MTTRPTLRWRLLLVLLLAVMPLLELYVLIRVGRVIGAWPTVGLLAVSAVLGGWLIRREGRRAWAAIGTALETGRMPARELTDAGLVLLGGVLMLSPGFVSDLIGLTVILPVTRPLFRSLLTALVVRRLVVGQDARRPGPDPGGPIVRGDVVED